MSRAPAPVNGGLGGHGEAAGTINPAALSTPGQTGPSLSGSQPRGKKRSRSPEVGYDPLTGERQDEDDSKPAKKRGRPPKSVRVSESPVAQPLQSALPSAQTPQSAQLPTSQLSPPQASPSKATPTKAPVVKALPTVRDHTSNELNKEGDEYLPREIDEAGETKVAPNGAPLGGRQYRCRTFYMPNRGNRLFMLATECAKVLNYRDSYLLFNKNRSLFKIIANQIEKNDLIQQDILPSSYRSRQIAIVTARSMYRQFGSRLIVNGRRVRDDYWESKARKQGFTEDDPAGEKRPGAAKAREAAAVAAAESNAAVMAAIPTGPIIYNPTTIGQGGVPHGLPMIQSIPDQDLGDYSSVPRPRHEISGTAYQDKTQPSNVSDIMGHATQTAEYNSSLTGQRTNRANYLNEMWRRPHNPPPGQLQSLDGDAASSVTQAQRSPQQAAASAPAQSLGTHTPQPQHRPVGGAGYGQQQIHGIAQSPNNPMAQSLPGGAMQHRSPSIAMGVAGQYGQQQYGYPQGMWSQGPSQSSHAVQAPMQYGQHMQQQPSPHMPTAVHPQQLHSQQGGMQMGYNQVAGGMNPPGYPGVPRQQMYQHSPSPQHFLQQGQTATTQAMGGWSQAPAQGAGQNWQNFP